MERSAAARSLRLVGIVLVASTALPVPGRGAEPIPSPTPFGLGTRGWETVAELIHPRPWCPNGSAVIAVGNFGQQVMARPLNGSMPPPSVFPPHPSGTSLGPAGWDNQLGRLVNGDLLMLANATTSESLPAASQPAWWNTWVSDEEAKKAGVPIPRNGYRQAEELWRSSCGLDAASWSAPVTLDSALAGATDAAGNVQPGYCGKRGPWIEGWDRPELEVDPWGANPQQPRKQRIYVSSKCDRDDDNSSQVWMSPDTGATWSNATFRLPRSGVTAMTTLESGRLVMLQCEGDDAKVYWSDDFGKTLAVSAGVNIAPPGLSCAQALGDHVGLVQPGVETLALARMTGDDVLAVYPTVVQIASGGLPAPRDVQRAVVMRIDFGTNPPTATLTALVKAAADNLSVLQPHLIEDDRPVALDRMALLTWLETTVVNPLFGSNFGNTIQARAMLFRDFGPGSAAPPVAATDLSAAPWFEVEQNGDYMKGGSAPNRYGELVFLTSWPGPGENFLRTWTPKPFAGRTRLNAVWRQLPAGAAQNEIGSSLSLPELEAMNDDLAARGYHMRRVSATRLENGQVAYYAVWSPTGPETRWVAGWALEDLLDRDAKLQKQGFRIASATGFVLPAGVRYNAIWEAATGERPAIFGWGLDDFVKRDKELVAAGFRVASVDGFQMPEGPRFNVVWSKPTKPGTWAAGWTLADLEAKDKELPGDFHIVSLSAFVMPEGDRYNAVWEQGPFGSWIAGWDSVSERDEKRRQLGETIQDLNAFVVNGGS